MTIQINSKDAVERLIGNDTQVEIDLRNNIVQNFAEKHLKPLVNSDVIKQYVENLRQNVQVRIAEAVQESCLFDIQRYGNGVLREVKLKPELMNEIKRQVRYELDSHIGTLIQQASEQLVSRMTALIERKVQPAVEAAVGQIVASRVLEAFAPRQSAATGEEL